MISFESALQTVLENSQNYGEETVNLEDAQNRILAESVSADRDFPPFDRSTKDGIAINSKALGNDSRHFKIEGLAQAGSPQLALENPSNCIEIMTGAIIPKNSDTVVMYEHLRSVDDGFELVENVRKGQNIHAQGSDVLKGSCIMKPNIRLGPSEIGALASVGKYKVLVKKMPKIAVIATGNELVDVEQTPLPYQIRKSNSYTLKSLLVQEGISAEDYHFVDDKEILKERLQHCIEEYDLLLLSGGVSKGKFDFLPETFESLGIEKIFHKVLQRPGKPFWFGKQSKLKCAVFAFPGNPVSTFVNYHVYFKAWLNKTLGVTDSGFTVILEETITNPLKLTLFKGVKVSLKDGRWMANEIGTTGSGDVLGLTKIDGFIQLEPDSTISGGDPVRLVPTRKLW